jgi:hypothetical protein
MELIPVSEAAKRKGVSRQSVYDAIARNDIEARKPFEGSNLGVVVNESFTSWVPKPRYVESF